MTNDSESQLVSTHEELLSYFDADQVPYRLDSSSGRILLPIEHGSLQSTMALYWPHNANLVQMILGIPARVPEEQVDPVCRAIAQINHALAMPGFGFDAAGGYAYYRLVQPRRKDGSLTVADLQRLFSTTTRTAAQFSEPLTAIIEGTMSASDLTTLLSGT